MLVPSQEHDSNILCSKIINFLQKTSSLILTTVKSLETNSEYNTVHHQELAQLNKNKENEQKPLQYFKKIFFLWKCT